MVRTLGRREFVRYTGRSAAVILALSGPRARTAESARRFKLCLSPGAIGVQGRFPEIVELAVRHGFEAVEPNTVYLASLSAEGAERCLGELTSKGLVWGAAGLPVDFRQDEVRYSAGLSELRRIAPALQRAGVRRMSTWIMPCHPERTYLQNLKLHTSRLSTVADVLAEHSMRLGLEYVGTPSLRSSQKYPFVHTMVETEELIRETGRGNIGFVLDSWHWWCAGESDSELETLPSDRVISVDINDAPADIPKERQIDGQRELPAATGVIDIAGFLGALVKAGYDGPVRAEPFNRALNELDNEAGCSSVMTAMRRALQKLG